MSLGVERNAGVVYQAGSYKALAMFAAALKSGTRRSTAVAQLWETVSRALAVGEVQLDTIRLQGLQVTDEDIEEIVGALISSGLAVRNISVASNDIGDAGVGSLARLLDDEPPSYSSVLSSLDLRGNNIGSKGCQVLTERLRQNATLTSLDLSSNPLKSEGASYISKMLLDNFTIERLVISNTDMTEAGFTAVLAVLREGNNTVRELSIGSQLLRSREEVAACHVSRTLETPPCMLRLLDLSGCGMGDEGAYVLRGALTGHPTMRTLDLSRNRIGITGGQALAGLLVGDSSLSSLFLRANMIGDEGARAFKVVLLHSQTLTTLDLRSNDIHDPGLDALAEGMECNASIERLFVWGNHFGQASLRRFGGLDGGRFALVGVFLDVQPFVVDGVYHAAEKFE
ncbi:unnamed protein product [Ectocarpus fasciculatus]